MNIRKQIVSISFFRTVVSVVSSFMGNPVSCFDLHTCLCISCFENTLIYIYLSCSIYILTYLYLFCLIWSTYLSSYVYICIYILFWSTYLFIYLVLISIHIYQSYSSLSWRTWRGGRRMRREGGRRPPPLN